MGGQSTYIPAQGERGGRYPDHLRELPDLLPGSDRRAVQRRMAHRQRPTPSRPVGSTGCITLVAHRLLRVLLHLHGVQSRRDEPTTCASRAASCRACVLGRATAQYIKNVINRVTLPGGHLHRADRGCSVASSFYFTGNQLIQAFGGTSILIMIGVALDTMSKLESPVEDVQLRRLLQVIENAGQVARIFIAKSRAPFVGALFCTAIM